MGDAEETAALMRPISSKEEAAGGPHTGHGKELSASDAKVSLSRPEVPPSASNDLSKDERLHSTVRLNQFTLQFEDAALENAYKAFTHRRKKALWLRSLVPAAAFHILFGLGDCLEHPPDHLLVTIPARVFLSVLQISMFILVRWDLVPASESTMLVVSICNGIPTLLLYALQRSSLHQWDALFVVFGLSFYTIPKITPLGFVASTVGSWFTAMLYAILSLQVRPPTHPFESLMGFLYCAPVIGIFNTISYYSEYNSRERFVLRRRLRSESITLAVSCTKTLPTVVAPEGADSFFKTNKYSIGLVLWAAFTLGGWTSLPEMLKFVDEETGWAWFSHCAGVTMFLLVMTRQLQWLFVIPVFGAFLLWMMTLAMPASWIIISAHSVGYGLLLASMVVAMGVFSRFVFVWRELVSFLTRSCFLYPQLQAGLQDEYPLLVKIVSEYTAGMDPEIISSRDSASRAITTHQHSNVNVTPSEKLMSPRPINRLSPRRRALGALPTSVSTYRDNAQFTRDQGGSGAASAIKNYGVRTVLVGPQTPLYDEREESLDTPSNRMVSVLPSFKAGKCFFCSKNEAEHLVPACGMWGKWTHWRMSQQQDILFGSLALPGGGGSGPNGAPLVGKPVMSMCTSYYDVQQEKSELEQQVEALERDNKELRDLLSTCEERANEATKLQVHLHAEVRALQEKHNQELARLQTAHQKKLDDILNESNHAAHQSKLKLREFELANKKLLKSLRSACLAAKNETEEQEQQKQDEVISLRQEVDALRRQLQEMRSSVQSSTSIYPMDSSTNADSVDSPMKITAIQPSRRLPYARWLEIEGLRESVARKDEGVSGSSNEQPWLLN